MSDPTIKAYKGFNRDMTCRDFQYEEGGEYKTERAKACDAGFHACERPTAGECGAATAGYAGAATSRGSASVGAQGIACVRGNGVKVKGGLGAVLVICEENCSDYDIAAWKAVVVDGETVKADTWYQLNNGELEEVTDK